MWVNMYVHSVCIILYDCEHIKKMVGHLYFHLNMCRGKCSIANISQKLCGLGATLGEFYVYEINCYSVKYDLSSVSFK